MRVDYSEDEGYPGEFALFQANCTRSLKGKAGQAALRELEAALLALPAPRLAGNVVAAHGDVCAVGAVLLARKARELGGDLAAAQAALEAECGDPEDQAFDETTDRAEELGMPRLVAWKVVAKNDVEFPPGRSVRAEGPNLRPYRDEYYSAGAQVWIDATAEDRYAYVLRWVQRQLGKD